MEEKPVKKKLDEQLLKRLRSGEEDTVLKALADMRSSGNLAYVPELLAILNDSESETIHWEMANLFADIRDKAVMPLFIKGLKDPKLPNIRMAVAAACWQSGMDYSAHLDLFIDIFIKSDYMTSLESFSVIEQSLENLTGEEIMEKRKLVLKGLEKISENKKPLARELISLMQT